jgi:hypothetical protein
MRVINIEQGSDEWHEERNACVTGTRIQAALGAKYTKKNGWKLGDKDVQHTLLCELVSEMQSVLEITDFQTDSMMRGTELEPYSVQAASEEMGVQFQTCGMLQHDTIDMFKFSPDAVYHENGVIVGGYETKSKMGKKHIEYILENEVPNEHLWQCLCPMIMDDKVRWWAFGHYDDRNEVNELFLKVIMREEYAELIAEARTILVEFLELVRLTNEEMKGEK